MPKAQRIETDDILPGDRLDLRELGDEIVSRGWMTYPWSGRGEEWVRSERDLAKVTSIGIAMESCVITFENYSPWYVPRGMTITAHAPH